MDNEKTIDVLNKLVQINNDRIEGYQTASKETEEHDLKTMFAQFTKTSEKNNQELSTEITKLGGTPTDGTKNTGKFFRVWMDLKAALTSKDRKAILNSCEFGEDEALETYEDVQENDAEHLSAEQKSMVTAQYELLKTDHDTVKNMRDALVEA